MALVVVVAGQIGAQQPGGGRGGGAGPWSWRGPPRPRPRTSRCRRMPQPASQRKWIARAGDLGRSPAPVGAFLLLVSAGGIYPWWLIHCHSASVVCRAYQTMAPLPPVAPVSRRSRACRDKTAFPIRYSAEPVEYSFGEKLASSNWYISSQRLAAVVANECCWLQL